MMQNEKNANIRQLAAEVLDRNRETILVDWMSLCRSNVPAARAQTKVALLDSVPSFLEDLSTRLKSDLSGGGKEDGSSSGQEHGVERASLPEYDLSQVIFEYHWLRKVLLRAIDGIGAIDCDTREIIHEFIDRGLEKSAESYVKVSISRSEVLKKENEQIRQDLNVALIKSRDLVENLEREREIRDRFVSALTHDLRTPMSGVKLSAQLLLKRANDPAAVAKACLRITRGIGRIDGMIRDLLDVNRIKAGGSIPMSFQPCRLDEIAASVVADLSMAEGTSFQIENSSGAIEGYWDASGLERILENLLGNAVKYGTRSIPVVLRLCEEADAVEIEVHNKGNTISSDDLKKLFMAFQRSDSAIAGGQKGWGIGLALVKAIAEAHRGSIRAESTEAQGTSFFVRLPKDARPTDALPSVKRGHA